MVEFFRGLSQVLSAMDAKAATSVGLSIVLLFFVIMMFFFGPQWMGLHDDGRLNEALMRAANSPWAVLGVMSVFSLLALTGFPQILLITATVIVFGPFYGAIYAWIATMVSGTLTFGLGHFLGGPWVRRLSGDRALKTIDFIGRHGVLASGLIRVVPSGPFMVVNATAGAAHIPMWKFWLGTGVGIIPKILVVALLGAFVPSTDVLNDGVAGVVDFFTSRNPRDIALMIAIIALWLLFLFLVRVLYKRLRTEEEAS